LLVTRTNCSQQPAGQGFFGAYRESFPIVTSVQVKPSVAQANLMYESAFKDEMRDKTVASLV